MKTTLARRTAANLRAAFAIVAFTALAAVGFATANSLRPALASNTERAAIATTPASTSRTDLHTAPAGCPLPAGAFRVR